MKRIYKITAFVLALALSSCAYTFDENEGGQGNNGNGTEQKVPILNTPEGAAEGEILIKFRPEISDLLDQAQTRSGAAGVLTRTGISTVDQLMEIVGGYELERVFPLDKRNEERTRKSGLHLWYTVRFDKDTDVQHVANQLSQLGELSKIEYSHEIRRNYNAQARPLRASDLRQSPLQRSGAFNDPHLSFQWHYINKGDEHLVNIGNGDEPLMEHMIKGADVNLGEAWEKCAGDPSIIVAVMDEGVMWDHADLKANMWVNEDEIYKSSEDNDGNGYKGDVYGFNFVSNTGVITWDNIYDTGHGTHVAGTIAAVNNNGIGVAGVAGGSGNNDGVKIMSLQIFSGNTGVSTQNEVRAIKYAADNGAVILQCSWGYMSALANPVDFPGNGYRTDEEYEAALLLEKEAFDYFIHNAGSPNGVIDGGVVIFASGNEFAAMSAYPGAYKDFISVSAMAADYTPSTFTNYGPGCNITAPGGDTDYHMNEHGGVLSTLPPQHGDYGYMDGTSMACPHTSGVAALGLSYAAKLHKRFDSRQYRDLILRSVRDIDAHFNADKFYFYNWTSAGELHPTLIDMKKYKGKMGTGLIDADILLQNVANEGAAITLPNVYVNLEAQQIVDVMRCFTNGETSTFTATSGNTAIATVEVNGRSIVVTGKAVGSTSFTVRSSTGESQTAHITVRKSANDNGWF